MRFTERVARAGVVLACAGLAYYFAFSLQLGSGSLWKGLGAAHAVTKDAAPPYDLTHLAAVNETLKKIKSKYVEPKRVKPRQMFVSALNFVQKEVAQVIVTHKDRSPSVTVKVGAEERDFRVDNIQAAWDVSARLRDVFAFLQENLRDTDVDLREVEYAACNGILATLDPHSAFLSPEAFTEMTMSTSGHFGGLGIVISIRDQMLTVMRPMPDTPAGRAKLKRLDRITKINSESTTNMPLDDAVKRLRGKPGSTVTVWIHRDGPQGWEGARPFELTREEISIKAIDYRPLKPGIGYVRIKQFQATTDSELEAALQSMNAAAPLQGLVLDLRNNPGGLLDQARLVADRFLERGVIVSTVGGSEGRKEEQATRRGTEPDYPIVVLINGSSASASEIVSGALKNHDRAVLVGQTTFGKGSVQLVFSSVAEGAALKLTIAQYLTPGDISIQGVGVTPDIELDPMTANLLEMDLFTSERPLRERDLDKSLTYSALKNTDRPGMQLRYNLPEEERKELWDLGGDIDDSFRLDFPIRLARDLVGVLPRGNRKEQLASSQEFLAQVQSSELKAISSDLRELGVDWAPAPEGATGSVPEDFDVKVSTSQPNNKVTAGKELFLKVAVTNKGKHPIYRLRAITKSDTFMYDERELIFGKLLPGETKEVQAPAGHCETKGRKRGSSQPLPLDAPRECSIPADSVTREDIVKVRFSAEGGEPPADAELRPTIAALPQPRFAYTFQVVDNRSANGDGQVSRGEGATVYLDIKNVGDGPSMETEALLRNLAGDGLLLKAGRFDVSNMQPGETRQVGFTFDVLESLATNDAKFEISVIDNDLHVIASEKVALPITKTRGLFIETATGRGKAKKDANVQDQPARSASVVGSIMAGTVVAKTGAFGEYFKVDLNNGRFGFVARADLEDTTAAPSAAGIEPHFTHYPPQLDVKVPALATRTDTIRIEAVATDLDQITDAYAFVGSEKVLYQSNAKSNTPSKLSFSQDIKLHPGINVVTVVARENKDVVTAQTIVVRRDGAGGEALPTPKRQVFGADWVFGSP